MKPPSVRTAGDAGPASPGRRDPPAAADAPSPSGWPRYYRLAWVLSFLLLLVAFAWVRTGIGGPRVVQVFSDAIVALGAIVAALAVTYAASRIDTSMRRGWRLLAVGVWLEAIGESLWVAFSSIAGAAPYPGVPDLFYLAGYAFIAAGFVNLAVDPRDKRPWIRFTLDGVVVATALLTLGWHFVLDPLLEPGLLGDLESGSRSRTHRSTSSWRPSASSSR